MFVWLQEFLKLEMDGRRKYNRWRGGEGKSIFLTYHCVVVFMKIQQVVFVLGLFVMRSLGRVPEGQI